MRPRAGGPASPQEAAVLEPQRRRVPGPRLLTAAEGPRQPPYTVRSLMCGAAAPNHRASPGWRASCGGVSPLSGLCRYRRDLRSHSAKKVREARGSEGGAGPGFPGEPDSGPRPDRALNIFHSEAVLKPKTHSHVFVFYCEAVRGRCICGLRPLPWGPGPRWGAAAGLTQSPL